MMLVEVSRLKQFGVDTAGEFNQDDDCVARLALSRHIARIGWVEIPEMRRVTSCFLPYTDDKMIRRDVYCEAPIGS